MTTVKKRHMIFIFIHIGKYYLFKHFRTITSVRKFIIYLESKDPEGPGSIDIINIYQLEK